MPPASSNGSAAAVAGGEQAKVSAGQQAVQASGPPSTVGDADADAIATSSHLDLETVKLFEDKIMKMSKQIKRLGEVLAPWTLVENKQRAKDLAASLDKDGKSLSATLRAMVGSHENSQRLANSDHLKETELLQEKVDATVKAFEELRAESEKSARAKAELECRCKNLNAKLADGTQMMTREITSLTAQLKEVTDAKDSGIVAARKDLNDQLAAKKKDMQRRLDAAKVEVDGYKAREKTLRVQQDEAHGVTAKTHDEVKALKSRMADVRAAKEDVLRDLEVARLETEELGSAYKEVLGLLAEAAGPQALPFTKGLAQHGAPFPRTAFTVRHGRVLYNRAIHPGIETSKIEPRSYGSHKELVKLLADEGLVLSKACGPGSF